MPNVLLDDTADRIVGILAEAFAQKRVSDPHGKSAKQEIREQLYVVYLAGLKAGRAAGIGRLEEAIRDLREHR